MHAFRTASTCGWSVHKQAVLVITRLPQCSTCHLLRPTVAALAQPPTSSAGEGVSGALASSSHQQDGAAQQDSQSAPVPSQITPRRPRLKARELGRVLNVSEDVAAVLLQRTPELSHHTAHRLQSTLASFAKLLKLDTKAATSLALKQPRVLLVPPDDLTPHLTQLAGLLKVTEDTARSLVRQQPGLITHQPKILRARLAALVALIKEAVAIKEGGGEGAVQVSTESIQTLNPAANAAVGMVRREPGLLALTHQQLVSRLAALSAGLGSTGSLLPALLLAAQAPTCVMLPPSHAASVVAALASLLNLPTRAAGDVLTRQPRLLMQSSDTLTSNFRGLSSQLGVEREAAAVMCTEQPGLLLLSPQDVPTRLKALAASLGVGQDKVKELLRSKPALLLKDPKAVDTALAAARKKGQLPPK